MIGSVLGTPLGHDDESEVGCDIGSELGIVDVKALGRLLGVDDVSTERFWLGHVLECNESAIPVKECIIYAH